jgi:hypothetical protein
MMTTTREDLYAFLERLSDSDIEMIYTQVKKQFEPETPTLPLKSWLQEMVEIRAALAAKYHDTADENK